jgi:hypothetical protein
LGCPRHHGHPLLGCVTALARNFVRRDPSRRGVAGWVAGIGDDLTLLTSSCNISVAAFSSPCLSRSEMSPIKQHMCLQSVITRPKSSTSNEVPEGKKGSKLRASPLLRRCPQRFLDGCIGVRPRGLFCPTRPNTMYGARARPRSTWGASSAPDRVRSEMGSSGPDASLTHKRSVATLL